METRRDFLTNLLAGFGLAARPVDPRNKLYPTYKIGPPAPSQQAPSDYSRLVVGAIKQFKDNGVAASAWGTLEEVPLGYDLYLDSLNLDAGGAVGVNVQEIRFSVWHPSCTFEFDGLLGSIIQQEYFVHAPARWHSLSLNNPQVFPERSILLALASFSAANNTNRIWCHYIGRLFPR